MSDDANSDRMGPIGLLCVAFVLYCLILLATNFAYAPEGNRALGEYLAVGDAGLAIAITLLLYLRSRLKPSPGAEPTDSVDRRP